VPWTISGANVGFALNPGGNLSASTSSPTKNSYYSLPQFYISDAGASAMGANREIFQVDAFAFGATTTTVAVVESTYEVLCTACPL
jgi:Tfp pilus assembly protein PilX